MKLLLNISVPCSALLLAISSFAAVPAGAPAGSTGLCKDGSYYSGATKQGACRGHQGVKEWYGAAAVAPAAAPATGAAPAAGAKPATAMSAKPKPAASADKAPAAGATGQCKDGTYSTAASKQGACRGHQGVKDWYGSAASAGKATSAPAPMMPAKPASAAMSPAPTVKAAPAMTPAAPAPTMAPRNAPLATAAPGGGAGQVWVNASTKVYHCPGDRWYGKTKEGAYMTEANAKAKGYRPDHDKACQ